MPGNREGRPCNTWLQYELHQLPELLAEELLLRPLPSCKQGWNPVALPAAQKRHLHEVRAWNGRGQEWREVPQGEPLDALVEKCKPQKANVQVRGVRSLLREHVASLALPRARHRLLSRVRAWNCSEAEAWTTSEVACKLGDCQGSNGECRQRQHKSLGGDRGERWRGHASRR